MCVGICNKGTEKAMHLRAIAKEASSDNWSPKLDNSANLYREIPRD